MMMGTSEVRRIVRQHLESVDSRDHQVQQDQVGSQSAERLEALGPRPRQRHFESVVAQDVRDGVGEARLGEHMRVHPVGDARGDPVRRVPFAIHQARQRLVDTRQQPVCRRASAGDWR